MSYFKQKKMTGITLVAAVGCNLNCAYCEINKSMKNVPDAKEFVEANRQALIDGSYIKNILAVMTKLNINPQDIDHIDIWGQEPTLILNLLTEHLDEWFAAFPRLHNFMFSTNGVAFPERIVDFAVAVDKHLTYNGTFSLQYSFDGIDQTNNIRKATSETILKNIEYFIDKTNTIKFNHLSTRIDLHGVLTLDMMHKLDTTEKIEQFALENARLTRHLSDKCLNKNVSLQSGINFGEQTPIKATKEDGILFSKFFQLGDSISKDLFRCSNETDLWNCLYGCLSPFSGLFVNRETNEINLKAGLQRILTGYEDPEFVAALSQKGFCGANNTHLKIMYDGTLLPCQNHMYELKTDHLTADDDVQLGFKKDLVTHYNLFNPLKVSDKIIQRQMSYYSSLQESSFYSTLTQVYGLMYYLMLAHQIDPSYRTDCEKFLLHGIFITVLHQCTYTNVLMTGSAVTKFSGLIRLYCNGYLDNAEILLRERGVY